MAKATKARKNTKAAQGEPDSAYFLKIVLYIVLGAVWVRFATPIEIGSIMLHGLPIGLLIGLLFASHDHFQVDRKIEYAVLIIAAILSFFLPTGILL